MKPEWMPPLPDKFPGEVKQWMLDYALAAIEAYKKSLKPVAYERQYWHKGKCKLRELSYHPITAGADKAVPLYRLDGGNDE